MIIHFFLPKKPQSMIFSWPGNLMAETSKIMVLLGERFRKIDWPESGVRKSPRFGRSSDLSFQME